MVDLILIALIIMFALNGYRQGFLVGALFEGKADIAFALVDNVVAYQEGQGEAKIPDNPDLFVFMGGDGGFMSLVAANGCPL